MDIKAFRCSFVLLASEEAVEKYNLTPLCEVVGIGQGGVDPEVDSTLFYEDIENQEETRAEVEKQIARLKDKDLYERFEDIVVHALHERAREISEECIIFNNASYQNRDMRIDHVVTSKGWGLVWMVVLLSVIFWITISGRPASGSADCTSCTGYGNYG